MRTLVQPPPSSHCERCGGELRLKRVEPANRMLNLENEVFVCAKCGREQSYTVDHNHTMPHPRWPSETIAFPPSPTLRLPC